MCSFGWYLREETSYRLDEITIQGERTFRICRGASVACFRPNWCLIWWCLHVTTEIHRNKVLYLCYEVFIGSYKMPERWWTGRTLPIICNLTTTSVRGWWEWWPSTATTNEVEALGDQRVGASASRKELLITWQCCYREKCSSTVVGMSNPDQLWLS